MTIRLDLPEGVIGVEIVQRRPDLRLRIGERVYAITDTAHADGAVEVTVDGRTWRGWRWVGDGRIHLKLGGRTFVVGIVERDSNGAGRGDAQNEVRADMPGTVVAVHVEAGSAVGAGEPLVTIESMKLQVTIAAPRAARIASVERALNTTFDRGAVLVRFAAEAEG